MNRKVLLPLLLLYVTVFTFSCAVVGGIFKAGMAWGIILVFLVIFGIIYLVVKMRK